MGTLPMAVALGTTRTASPPSHDHNNDVIYLGAQPTRTDADEATVTKPSSRLRQPSCPRPKPDDKKQPSRQSFKTKKSKPKSSHRGPVRKESLMEYARVGWMLSSGNNWHVVYGSLDRSGQPCYWSHSAPDDCQTIKHEDIHFRSMFQKLSPDEIRKKLPGKMRRARGRSVQDET
ncbi:hypothetical protein CI238_13027 [Colletotrichum incanum]|uniref:Uncharacterized protein n=1 Tax=Colletotrichum incanum TaxID=1573173 RepID=A0A167AZH9_COLIC|nr:hypothetical protein CI238_13027 [Colletotrichum incanum]